jgi:hypothetical protein
MNYQSFVGTYPYSKLDTQNIVSFQTISILFNKEPPQSPSSTPYYTSTLIYQFKHGYNYISSPWMNWQNDSPSFPSSPASGSSATSFYPNGDDTAGRAAWDAIDNSTIDNGASVVALTEYNNSGPVITTTQAILYVTVDTTSIYIYVMKQTLATIGGNVIPLYLAGTTLNLRVYAFVEPANTSTY